MNTTRKLEALEERLMEDLVQDVGGSEDPVEQFKAIERYMSFVKARATRMEGERCLPALKN